jgi:hypothetical protein
MLRLLQLEEDNRWTLAQWRAYFIRAGGDLVTVDLIQNDQQFLMKNGIERVPFIYRIEQDGQIRRGELQRNPTSIRWD